MRDAFAFVAVLDLALWLADPERRLVRTAIFAGLAVGRVAAGAVVARRVGTFSTIDARALGKHRRGLQAPRITDQFIKLRRVNTFEVIVSEIAFAIKTPPGELRIFLIQVDGG